DGQEVAYVDDDEVPGLLVGRGGDGEADVSEHRQRCGNPFAAAQSIPMVRMISVSADVSVDTFTSPIPSRLAMSLPVASASGTVGATATRVSVAGVVVLPDISMT